MQLGVAFFNPRTQKAEAGLSESKTHLVYRVNFRTTQKPWLKRNKTTKRNKTQHGQQQQKNKQIRAHQAVPQSSEQQSGLCWVPLVGPW